ncbi:hypothetical protein ACGFZQ_36800 [Streptomyces sp. NPDC048254]|uniref:hypothetical protein n=1 Tax=Streptomyces sp. NPDC048254 TaxID=3365525 RepID=UPI0037156E3B
MVPFDGNTQCCDASADEQSQIISRAPDTALPPTTSMQRFEAWLNTLTPGAGGWRVVVDRTGEDSAAVGCSPGAVGLPLGVLPVVLSGDELGFVGFVPCFPAVLPVGSAEGCGKCPSPSAPAMPETWEPAAFDVPSRCSPW